MRRSALLAVCLLLLVASPVRAEFYRWVDRDGKEFFTNDREKIPQEYQGSATAMHPDENRVSVENKGSKPGKTSVTVKEHRDKNGKGEEYWRKKAANLRRKLRDQQEAYDEVLKRLADEDRNPGKRKKKAVSSLEKKKLKLEKDIARTRRMLEVELPEEARKADAYPGWLRE